ncbi:MAG: hypothetical protein ACOCX4_04265 [Planctomycetota bacterium]
MDSAGLERAASAVSRFGPLDFEAMESHVGLFCRWYADGHPDVRACFLYLCHLPAGRAALQRQRLDFRAVREHVKDSLISDPFPSAAADATGFALPFEPSPQGMRWKETKQPVSHADLLAHLRRAAPSLSVLAERAGLNLDAFGSALRDADTRMTSEEHRDEADGVLCSAEPVGPEPGTDSGRLYLVNAELRDASLHPSPARTRWRLLAAIATRAITNASFGRAVWHVFLRRRELRQRCRIDAGPLGGRFTRREGLLLEYLYGRFGFDLAFVPATHPAPDAYVQAMRNRIRDFEERTVLHLVGCAEETEGDFLAEVSRIIGMEVRELPWSAEVAHGQTLLLPWLADWFGAEVVVGGEADEGPRGVAEP